MENISAKSSLRNKIILLTLTTVILVYVSIAGFAYIKVSQLTLNTSISNLAEETRLLTLKFKDSYDKMKNDVFVIANTPPILGIARTKSSNSIDPVDNSSTYMLWRARLETIFSSLMKVRPYTQMRYIGIENDGREIVRVNKNHEVIQVVPESGLQQKSQETYFKEGLNLKDGEFYFSEVTYNKEFGEIEGNLTPTIRIVTPVFSEDGERFGMVVINADYRELLSNSIAGIKSDKNIFVINNNRDFVEYNKEGEIGSFDFHKFNDYTPPTFITNFLSSNNDEELITEDTHVTYFVKLFITNHNKNTYVGIIIRKLQSEIFEESNQLKGNIAAIGISLLFLLSALVLYFSNKLTAPLLRITHIINDYKDFDSLSKLPLDEQNEIGALCRALYYNIILTLQDSERQLSATINNAVDGLITIDEMGNIEKFNPACEKIFGYTSEELIGKNIKILMPEPYHSNHDDYIKNYKDTAEKKIIGSGREVKAKRKDGNVFPIDLSISEIEVSGKRKFNGIIRDITERENLIKKLVESNADLERFAYIASHDLQEPLRMVFNYSELLGMELEGKLNEKQQKMFGFVKDGAAHMQSLVSDILEYSKLGEEEKKYSKFDVKIILNKVLKNFKNIIETTQAKITVSKMPKIQGNEMRFSRLLQNLIGNALKYQAPEKLPKITVKCEDYGKDPSFWLFSISDNGIGIKDEYTRQIFEPFRRLHNRFDYAGTGIGLAICKKIVENEGGTIWVESKIDKGTIFYFTYPKIIKS